MPQDSKSGGELFIVDNTESDWKVLRYLKEWTRIAKSFDIATGHFEIGGMLALDGEWQRLEKIRLLMADSNPTDLDPLRVLVLDDVLIGLDISNRLPLLELLRVEFPYHQIMLLTHDELWFSIAREHTQHWGSWRSAQLFVEITGHSDPAVPRLRDTTDDLAVAQRYLDGSDLRSAAVYIRAAFESKLRKTCEDQNLKLAYKQDVKKVSAQMLWDAVLARHNEMVAAGGEFLDSNLIPGVNAVRSQILNRLSHDGGLGLTRTDVQTAIATMGALRGSNIPHRQ